MDLKRWPYCPFKPSHRTKPDRKSKGGGGKELKKRAVWYERNEVQDGKTIAVRVDCPKGKKQRRGGFGHA